MAKPDVDALAAEQIARWAADPVGFVFDVFGPGYEERHQKPLEMDAWQDRGLRYLVAHEPHGTCDGSPAKRLALKACKGPGKSTELNWIGWWRLVINRIHRGAAVSITGDNLFSGLWPELALWRSYSPLLMAAFDHQGRAINGHGEDNWWLQARTFAKDADRTHQAETMAGLHAKAVTVLLDEVGSFPQGVYDAARAIFNTKGDDALLAVAGNATDVDGVLHTICTEDAEDWHIIEITGDPEDPEHSSRVDIEQAAKDIKKYGRDNPMVMVNWLGKFPPKGGNRLLSSDEVSAAIRRNCSREIYEPQPLVWGLDVAGEGVDPDAAKLYRRRGPVCFMPRTWRNAPTLRIAEQVALEYGEAKRNGKPPKKIFVDKGGIGRGCWERLTELLGSKIVVGVDFGESALDDTLYYNRRTEMWFRMAMWVRDNGCLPKDVPELRRDLTAPSVGSESTTSKGTRHTLESKKEMKKRGLPSPDDGDGLALTFAFDVFADDPEAELAARMGAKQQFNPFKHLGGRT